MPTPDPQASSLRTVVAVLAQAFRAKNAAMRAKFDLKLHFMREFLKAPVRSATLCKRPQRTVLSAPAIG